MPDQNMEQHEEQITPMPQPDPATRAPKTDAAPKTDTAAETDAAEKTDTTAETDAVPEPEEAADKRLSEEEALAMLRQHQQAYRQRIEDAKARIRTRAEWRRAKALGRTYTYTAQPGDTLETVARIFYAKPERWPEIYEANATKLPGPAERHPQPLEPGIVLFIP